VNTKPQILIVDDEHAVCDLLSEELTERGYQCSTALDSVEALKEIQKQDFDAALLDIKLPAMSGLELLSRMRSECPNTSVIMITSVCNADSMVEAFRLGALHYVMKPFDLDEVGVTVRLVLETNGNPLEREDHQRPVHPGRKQAGARPKKAYFEELIAKASVLEENDKYLSGHSQRVAAISVSIAQQLALPQHDIENIEIAALVHDIGMIGVNESIPTMQAHLDWRRFRRIAYHCEAGELILAHHVKDYEILSIVRHHHERYDGGGYPDGLCGDDIPLGARILALAEAYDAMTSRRPYRAAMSAKAACAEIERCKGSQFDPEVADAFLAMKRASSKSRQVSFSPDLPSVVIR
jgi:response regulator RpfG family c-di-GMP phosphodiesterase